MKDLRNFAELEGSIFGADIPILSTLAVNTDAKSEGSMTDPYQDLISLAEAAKRYGLTPDYLRQLAIKGRLKARKVGRNWVTTPADVEDYINTRRRIGAFRDDLTVKDSGQEV